MEVTNEELRDGHDPTENIVACEVVDDEILLFIEEDGEVRIERRDMEYWVLSAVNHKGMKELKGDLFYEYIWTTDSHDELKKRRKIKNKEFYKKQYWCPYNLNEMAMISDGFTFFKGMNPEDVSILSFDIESEGLRFDKDAEVYIITNTFRRPPRVPEVKCQIERKKFTLDEYEDSGEMIQDWCDWVREIDPTILTGHRIYNYDFLYLRHVAKLNGMKGLQLGRDDSNMYINPRIAQFRYDGSRDIDYNKMHIFGRQIVDTWFLSMRFDAATLKYENYQLKYIMEVEGLEKKGRIKWDFEKHPVREIVEGLVAGKKGYKKMWKDFNEYAEDDADDALALFDLMIAPYFTLTKSIPRTFQDMLVTAAGAQLNNLMLRSYLIKGHSIPQPDDRENFQGAYSYGNPGPYYNVFKVDVAGMYPSIIRQFEIYDSEKDPLGHLLLFVNDFTDERLKNKGLYKETGDKKYDHLQGAQKIINNSFYGFLNTPGVHFNSPPCAADVTRYGREILNHAADLFCGGEFYHIDGIKEAQYKINKEAEYILVNADTDSISFHKPKMKKFTEDETEDILETLNEACKEDFGDYIEWEDDGLYKSFIVVAAKNYATLKEGKGEVIKYKGGSFKNRTTEPVFRDYKKQLVDLFIKKKQDEVIHLYFDMIKRIMNIGSPEEPIDGWCKKYSVTKSLLEANTTAKQKVLKALEHEEPQLEDRFYLYNTDYDTLRLPQEYLGDHDAWHYMKRLYASTKIFHNILDIQLIPNYSNKGKRDLLKQIL